MFFFKKKSALGIENAETTLGVGLTVRRRIKPCLNGEISIKHNNR
jgi:hypothetical protein